MTSDAQADLEAFDVKPGSVYAPASTDRPPGSEYARHVDGSEHRPPTRRRKVIRGVLVATGLLVLIGGLVAIKASQIGMLIGMGEKMAKAGPPPEVVSTVAAEQQTWEGTLSAVASVVSEKGVALSNDSPGVVARLYFESGAQVKKGQVLVELDTSVERAQLTSLKARRDLANTSLERSQSLASAGVIAKSQLDNDQASFKSMTADVSALEAQIARKIIRAPFGGKLGLREVNVGQYLAPGTRVTVLESSAAVFVDFTLPQKNLDRLKPGVAVRAFEENTTKPLGEGTITAIEPAIDAVTRNIKVRASIPNLDERVRPGMFVNVDVIMPERGQVIAVPLTSVVRASYGDSVFSVESQPGPDGKPRKVAQQHFVKLGESRGDFVAVQSGVKPGQELITAGAFKLRNGIPIVVNNSVKPEPKLTPRPANE